MIGSVDAETSEDGGGREEDAVPCVTTEAREPVQGTWWCMVKLAL